LEVLGGPKNAKARLFRADRGQKRKLVEVGKQEDGKRKASLMSCIPWDTKKERGVGEAAIRMISGTTLDTKNWYY